jgi:hypothetical protein
MVKFHHLGLEASNPAFAPLCPRLTFTSKAKEFWMPIKASSKITIIFCIFIKMETSQTYAVQKKSMN